MSTILNTLKKLEEEKSVLDRSLNLKGLVLQTDRALYPQAERANISPGKALLALVIGGIALVAWLLGTEHFAAWGFT